jgi:DNA-binding GntR family transcriptional regulator
LALTNDRDSIAGLVPASMRVRKETTAERAAGVLRGLIVRGEIEPLQPLRETDLAPELGVSRNTIREALRILAREALVAPSHRNVYTVVEVSADDVPDIFKARAVIEFAAAEAIREDDSGLDLTEMKAAVDELERLSPDVDWWEVVDADVAFHAALVAQAGSQRLNAMYTQLEGEVRLCLCVSSQFQVPLEDIVAEHAEFIALLEKGKYEQFEKKLRRGMDNASRRLIDLLTAKAAGTSSGAAA